MADESVNEAELALVGGLLHDSSNFHEARSRVKPDDFLGSTARNTYLSMLALDDRGIAIDAASVLSAMTENGSIESAGGKARVKALLNYASGSAGAPIHAAIVARQSRRRRIRKACLDVVGQLDEAPLLNDAEAMELFSDVQNQIVEATSVGSSRLIRLKDGLGMALKYAEHRYENKDSFPGYRAELCGIDKTLNGLKKKSLIVIGAKTGAGKTALALHIALACGRQKAKVMIASYEMGADELSLRMLANVSGVSNFTIDSGNLQTESFSRMMNGISRNSSSHIVMTDNPPDTIESLRAEAQSMKRKEGLDVLIVDYLQLVGGSSSSHNREREVASVSRTLKRMAMQLDICVIALSQLNRANKTTIAPELSDLRESGAIEQDANAVIFLWQPDETSKNKLSWRVAKNRGGPCADGTLTFEKSVQRFIDLEY